MELRFERLVVPVAGGEADAAVLAMVPPLAGGRAVAVTLLYVVAVPQSMPLDAELHDDVAHGERALARAEAWLTGHLAKGADLFTELLQARSVGAAIVDEAIERSADAVVLGATLRRRHGRTELGETVDYVLLHAPCEVVVRRLGPDAGGFPGAPWR